MMSVPTTKVNGSNKDNGARHSRGTINMARTMAHRIKDITAHLKEV